MPLGGGTVKADGAGAGMVRFKYNFGKDGWNKLKKDIKAELNEELLDRLHGTVSLPFEAGENRTIAVKIVDDRGIESLKVIPLPVKE